jgi:hypothetical protein
MSLQIEIRVKIAGGPTLGKSFEVPEDKTDNPWWIMHAWLRVCAALLRGVAHQRLKLGQIDKPRLEETIVQSGVLHRIFELEQEAEKRSRT